MHDYERLIEAAKILATATPGFNDRRGPGANGGNGFTAVFKSKLDAFAKTIFSGRCRLEAQVASGCDFAVDYYFPAEAVIVELALSLQNSLSEFEKDLWKAALAKKQGYQVSKLVLLGKSGSVARHSSPGSRAVMELLRADYGIEVQVSDLS